MLYIALYAAVCAAVSTYFFYPLLVILLFGALWLLIPSGRSAISTLFRHFVEPAPAPLPGSIPVFILTFLWLFAVWIR